MTLDLTRPEGARVAVLRRAGRDIAAGDRLRVALNGYRAGGGGGYVSLARGRVLWTAPTEMRDLVLAWLEAAAVVDPRALGECNFRLLPDLSALAGAPSKCAAAGVASPPRKAMLGARLCSLSTPGRRRTDARFPSSSKSSVSPTR